jgi:geranylgeranylglycerol-phosphate geranylgeranyltransferase
VNVRRLKDLIVVTRPHNCLIASASVIVGAFLAAGSVSLRTMLASLIAFFVCAGAYALNDIFDVSSDKVNKPDRPLASGRLKRGTVVRAAVLLWAVGLGFAILSGGEVILFFVAWLFLLWLYSWRLKAQGLAGHLVVSTVASSGFILGGMTGGSVGAAFVPFSIALLFHFTREVAKSVMDARGDRLAGILTLAVRIGERRALSLALWCMGGVIAVSLLPFLFHMYGNLYMLPVAAVIYPLLAMSIYRILTAGDETDGLERASSTVARMLKAAMPVGLLAFFLARI